MPTTPRGAIPYPLGTDPPDTDGAIRAVAEATAAAFALYGQGTAAQRPAASAARAGMLYRSSDTGVVEWCTGAAWVAVSATQTLDFGEAADVSRSRPGDTAAAGSTGELADAGHVHGREPRYRRTFLTMGA